MPTESERPPELEQLTYNTPALGGACDVEDIEYTVYADITRPGSQLKSANATGALLVTVAESSSVIDCGEDVVRIATPGAELTSESFAIESDHVALHVPAVLIGGHRPSIRVAALLDLNNNGRCDDGELTASFEGDADELDALTLELGDERCPERQ